MSRLVEGWRWKMLISPGKKRCTGGRAAGHTALMPVFIKTQGDTRCARSAGRSQLHSRNVRAAVRVFLTHMLREATAIPESGRGNGQDACRTALDVMVRMQLRECGSHGQVFHAVKANALQALNSASWQDLLTMRAGIEAMLASHGMSLEPCRSWWLTGVMAVFEPLRRGRRAARVKCRQILLVQMLRAVQAMLIRQMLTRSNRLASRRSRWHQHLNAIQRRSEVLRSVGIHAILHITMATRDVTLMRIPFAESLTNAVVEACANPRALPICRAIDGWYLERTMTQPEIQGLWLRALALSERGERIQQLLDRLDARAHRLHAERRRECERLAMPA